MPFPSDRGRRLELLVLLIGLAAAGALVFAGIKVHGRLADASELAAARLAGTVAETVLLEWEQALRAPEPPVGSRGWTFTWDEGAGELEPYPAPAAPASLSVLATLLDEAERIELVEGDPARALALVLEALEREPEAAGRARGQLRALQLALRTGDADVARDQAARLASLGLEESCEGLPCRLLAAVALPVAMRAELFPTPVATPEELERLAPDEDFLALDGGGARFELAPIVAELCARLALDPPPLERRAVRAWARLAGAAPAVDVEGRWHVRAGPGVALLARRDGARLTWLATDGAALAHALAERAALPEGFGLDFAGQDESLGVAVHPPTALPGSALAFTLRHVDPARLGRAEASRRSLLRAALVALGLACAVGGALTARVLARERRLAALRSSFIAGVSHDLRTPLASILLLCENLESGAAAAGEARERTQRALRREATRLRRLVDDVLDFSRLERGQEPGLEREEVELAPFLTELASDLRERVEAAGRALETPAEWPEGVASLDAHATRRALENLVDNALKHGRGAVRLGCERRGERLVFSVTDEGPGVPDSACERIFAPFERRSANGHVGGTGLGLAIVRAIARAQGGEARVRPGPPGSGTTFELELRSEP